MKKTKWYSNPYQNEIWEAMKQKDQIDNEITYGMARILAFMMTLGVIYLIFK
jgi:phage terminase large subunit GpA-like protein